MADAATDLRQELNHLEERYRQIEAANRALNERLLELYALYTISVSLADSLDVQKTARTIRRVFKQSLEVDQFALWLADPKTGELTLCSHFGFKRPGHKAADGSTPKAIIRSLRLSRIVYIPDVARRAEKQELPVSVEGKGGAFLCLPLRGADRHSVGVITVCRHTPNFFDRQEIKLLDKIARQVALVIERIQLYEHTKALSITDELTGVYNRRYFNGRFDRETQHAKRYNRPLSVVMIDIDHFKNYNDLNGHLMGDDVLRKVARILQSNIRRSDVLARYGGEEFVILLPEISKEKAYQAAEKLRQSVEVAPFEGEDKQPRGTVTISAGLATFPDDAGDPVQLLDLADQALYAAKAGNRNRVIAHTPDRSGEYNVPSHAGKTIAAEH